MGSRRRTTELAWSLFSLWAAVAVAAAWAGLIQGNGGNGIFALVLVGYAFVGALVASRHPENAVGWLLLTIALTFGLQVAGETYVSSMSNPGYVAVAWATGWLFNVWFTLIVVFLPLLFPSGTLLSPRWRVVWWFDVVTMVAGVVVVGLTPGHLTVNAPIENPLGVHGTAGSVVEALARWGWLGYALAVVLSAVSLVIRFRRSTGVQRQQLKWFASAVLLALGGLMLAAIGGTLPVRWAQPFNDIGWSVFLFTCVLGLPVATGIAILRYRLYDIDVVINRTLVYVALTATLAAMYVVSILLLRVLLRPVTGESDLAVAGSTLAVAAVFRPARSWIQGGVDRAFYRRRYDAVHTIEEFTTRLRQELDLDAVGADLCTTVDHTMQPAHVSLWLRTASR